MLQTPLAVLRRVSTCPNQVVLAARMGVHKQSLSAIEAGRNEVSDEFLEKLARHLGFPAPQVVSAYLLGRKAWLMAQVRQTDARLAAERATSSGKRRSA